MDRRTLLLALATAGAAACAAPSMGGDSGDNHDASSGGTDATDTPMDDVAVADTAGPCIQSVVDAGALSDFTPGSWSLVTGTNTVTNRPVALIIGYDADGLFAFTAVCTHSACVVQPPNTRGVTFCNCHGSRFDGNGAVVNGPATRAMVHYALTVCDGQVSVDTAMRVVATTRTPV